MNVMNRSGSLFVCYLVFFILLATGNHFIEGFLNGEEKYAASFPVLFFLRELRRFYLKNDWYLYKFYPVDFFDRNAFVIILILYFTLVFHFISVLWVLAFITAIFLNELFMRKYYKRKAGKDSEIRELLGHQNYDGEKIELKSVEKNFFKRTWFILFVIFFLWIGMIATQKELFYHLCIVPCIFLILYEEYVNIKKIQKEIKEIVGKSEILTDMN
jgi:hypothetical protein